jgi:hypothetical protein
MPGPGQGKHSQKKKWRENAFNLNASIAAVNAIITASDTSAPTATTATPTMPSRNDETAITPLANETAPSIATYTAQLPPMSIITTTTAKAATYKATEDANDVTRVDTATDISSTNNVDSEPLPFTYTHDEVQKLIEEAQLGGWQQGFEEGHRTGRKTGKEEGKADGYKEGYEEGSKKWIEGHKAGYEAGKKMGKEKEETAHRNGQLEGYELGIQEGKEDEQRKWLTEGHGAGLCLSMAAHARALFRGAVLLEEAQTQTDATSVTWQTTKQPGNYPCIIWQTTK